MPVILRASEVPPDLEEFFEPIEESKESTWLVPSKPFKGSHFACYPPKLILPCVRAGSSERGVCPACGEPWVRVLKKNRRATRPGTDTKVAKAESGVPVAAGRPDPNYVGNRDPQRHVTTTETTGWVAGCKCNPHLPVPAVVCDPFAGSGTTLQVAVGEGRRAIGCELNPAYLKLIERRMAAVTPTLLAGVTA